MVKWPRLTNITEVSNFVGLAGYYQRFVNGFSNGFFNLVVPLTKLTRKNVKFE